MAKDDDLLAQKEQEKPEPPAQFNAEDVRKEVCRQMNTEYSAEEILERS